MAKNKKRAKKVAKKKVAKKKKKAAKKTNGAAGLPAPVTPQRGMQISQPDGRTFNPERDLVWSLPRLVSAGLRDLGEAITPVQLRDEYDMRYIDTQDLTDQELVTEFQNYTKQLAVYFNAVQAKGESPQSIGGAMLRILYPPAIAPTISRPRLLVSDLLFRRLLGELPFWIEQVRPGSGITPMPYISEIEDAVNKIIAGPTEPEQA